MPNGAQKKQRTHERSVMIRSAITYLGLGLTLSIGGMLTYFGWKNRDKIQKAGFDIYENPQLTTPFVSATIPATIGAMVSLYQQHKSIAYSEELDHQKEHRDDALKFYDKANHFFVAEEFDNAARNYKKAIDLYNSLYPVSRELSPENLMSAYRNWMRSLYLAGKYREVVDACEKCRQDYEIDSTMLALSIFAAVNISLYSSDVQEREKYTQIAVTNSNQFLINFNDRMDILLISFYLNKKYSEFRDTFSAVKFTLENAPLLTHLVGRNAIAMDNTTRESKLLALAAFYIASELTGDSPIFLKQKIILGEALVETLQSIPDSKQDDSKEDHTPEPVSVNPYERLVKSNAGYKYLLAPPAQDAKEGMNKKDEEEWYAIVNKDKFFLAAEQKNVARLRTQQGHIEDIRKAHPNRIHTI